MQVGLRTIHPTATRANRFVLWVWHSRLLLGREDLLAGHRVPMRWPARLAFVADVRGVSSRSPFVPWRAAAAGAVATVATLDALIRQSRNRRSGTARPVQRSSAMLWGMSPPTEAPQASESTLLRTRRARHMTQMAQTVRWCGGCSGSPPPNAWSTRKVSSIWPQPPDVHAIVNALEELQAVVRDDPRRLRLNKSQLQSAGHKLMETNQGPSTGTS
jgi:hypothetical protein